MEERLVRWLGRIIRRMLKGNNFEYDGEMSSQETGTANGAPFACAYSGVVIGRIEEEGIRWRERRGCGGGRVRGVEWKEGNLGEVD